MKGSALRSKTKSFFVYSTPLLLILILYMLGFRFVVILTDSMEPSIPRGSLAVTAPLWLCKPDEGSIILFRIELGGHEYYVMHRIVKMDSCIYTKGDNREFIDPWVLDEEKIIGINIVAFPLLGYILMFLKLPVMLAVVFASTYYGVVVLLKRLGVQQ